MAVRSAAKAILLQEGKILLNRCRDEQTGEIFYDLPGGGQQQYETLEDTVLREVREETGYAVEIVRFAALAEEIFVDERIRREYPDYAHRVLHIFLVRLTESEQVSPSELDYQQEESVWVELDKADSLPFRPYSLTGNIKRIVEQEHPVYFQAVYQ